MADNKLLLMNTSKANILSDVDLQETDWDTTGIVANELAYSSRLNALLRQVTTVTHSFAGLIAEKLNKNIGSYIDVTNSIEPVTPTLIENVLETVTLEVAPSKLEVRNANTIWAGPTTGTATAPTFRALVAADIPSLAASKITSGTFATERIADTAITAAKLASDAVETAKIKDDNVTFAKLQNSVTGLSVIGRGANSAGDFAELAAGTDGHVLRRSGTTLGFGTVTTAGIANSAITADKLGSSAVETAKIKDLNVTLAKLSRSDVLTSDGTKILDSLISDKHSSVIGYQGVTSNLANYIIRVVTQAEYTSLATKPAGTIYIISG